jgi:hypothetical protein
MADISAFKANLALGGARANQFYVQLQFPASVGAGPIIGQKGQFLCKGAQLPASTIDNTPVNYRGRQVNLAGERTFAPWTITILNDNDFALRNAFEAWMNSINNNQTNTGNIIPNQYQVDMQVYQLDRNGNQVKEYKFVDAYPTEVSAIELNFDTNNQVEEFTVTLVYNYWTSQSTAGNGAFGVGVTVNTPIGNLPLPVRIPGIN